MTQPAQPQPSLTLLPVKRLPEWSANLVDYLLEVRASQALFAWDPTKPSSAHMNCLTFVSGAVRAMTGDDLYAQLAADKVYTNALEAYRVLQDMGYTSLDQLIGSLFQEVRASRAQYGDLVIVPGNGEGIESLNQTAGIAEPPYYWVLSSNVGLTRGNLFPQPATNASRAIKAYKV